MPSKHMGSMMISAIQLFKNQCYISEQMDIYVKTQHFHLHSSHQVYINYRTQSNYINHRHMLRTVFNLTKRFYSYPHTPIDKQISAHSESIIKYQQYEKLLIRVKYINAAIELYQKTQQTFIEEPKYLAILCRTIGRLARYTHKYYSLNPIWEVVGKDYSKLQFIPEAKLTLPITKDILYCIYILENYLGSESQQKKLIIDKFLRYIKENHDQDPSFFNNFFSFSVICVKLAVSSNSDTESFFVDKINFFMKIKEINFYEFRSILDLVEYQFSGKNIKQESIFIQNLITKFSVSQVFESQKLSFELKRQMLVTCSFFAHNTNGFYKTELLHKFISEYEHFFMENITNLDMSTIYDLVKYYMKNDLNHKFLKLVYKLFLIQIKANGEASTNPVQILFLLTKINRCASQLLTRVKPNWEDSILAFVKIYFSKQMQIQYHLKVTRSLRELIITQSFRFQNTLKLIYFFKNQNSDLLSTKSFFKFKQILQVVIMYLKFHQWKQIYELLPVVEMYTQAYNQIYQKDKPYKVIQQKISSTELMNKLLPMLEKESLKKKKLLGLKQHYKNEFEHKKLQNPMVKLEGYEHQEMEMDIKMFSAFALIKIYHHLREDQIVFEKLEIFAKENLSGSFLIKQMILQRIFEFKFNPALFQRVVNILLFLYSNHNQCQQALFHFMRVNMSKEVWCESNINLIYYYYDKYHKQKKNKFLLFQNKIMEILFLFKRKELLQILLADVDVKQVLPHQKVFILWKMCSYYERYNIPKGEIVLFRNKIAVLNIDNQQFESFFMKFSFHSRISYFPLNLSNHTLDFKYFSKVKKVTFHASSIIKQIVQNLIPLEKIFHEFLSQKYKNKLHIFQEIKQKNGHDFFKKTLEISLEHSEKQLMILIKCLREMKFCDVPVMQNIEYYEYFFRGISVCLKESIVPPTLLFQILEIFHSCEIYEESIYNTVVHLLAGTNNQIPFQKYFTMVAEYPCPKHDGMIIDNIEHILSNPFKYLEQTISIFALIQNPLIRTINFIKLLVSKVEKETSVPIYLQFFLEKCNPGLLGESSIFLYQYPKYSRSQNQIIIIQADKINSQFIDLNSKENIGNSEHEILKKTFRVLKNNKDLKFKINRKPKTTKKVDQH